LIIKEGKKIEVILESDFLDKFKKDHPFPEYTFGKVNGFQKIAILIVKVLTKYLTRKT
jgi:hypothetical protein